MSFTSNVNEHKDIGMIAANTQSNYKDADDLYSVVEDE